MGPYMRRMRGLTLWHERIEPRVNKIDGGCWLWTGATNGVGYGKIGLLENGKAKYPYTHVIAYEALIGTVPDGLELDHLCRNTICCNPEHVEPVTSLENSMRGEHPNYKTARTRICKRGHGIVGDNIFRRSDGRLRCRACQHRQYA